MRINLLTFLFIIFSAPMINGQIERPALSPLQTIDQKIATTEISITYSRPAMRERKIFGGLVPFGEYWRTGANRNTTIEFSEDVIVGTTEVPAGKYAIFSKPELGKWTLYLYADTDNWDVPDTIDQEKIIASISSKPTEIQEPYQSFTISLDNLDLSLAWENTKISFPIQLKTEELMMKSIDSKLAGPTRGDYYLAAHYRLESGNDLEQALTWINKSLELSEKETWWVFSEKALIQKALKDQSSAKSTAQKALELAKAANSQYGINLMNSFIKDYK